MAKGDDLKDGRGVRLGDCRKLLPRRAADWPSPNIVRYRGVVADYRRRWQFCQVCEVPLTSAQCDVHHIVGGAGRSDERCNLLRLCTGCHDESWSAMLPVSLWAKWRTDRQALGWVRLAVLLGHHLPEPRPPAWYNKGA